MKTFLALLILLATGLSPSMPAAKPGCGIIPYGCEAWTATYDSGGWQDISPVLATAAGRVFVASIQDTSAGRQGAVHALDAATGTRIWNTTFIGEGGPEPRRIAASPDGALVHVIGTGYVGYQGRTPQAFVATFDGETGALRWALSWVPDSEGKDLWTDGTMLYAVGAVMNNYAVVAYDAATGAQTWAASYDAEGGWDGGWRYKSYDVAYDVTQHGGIVYATGVSAAPDGLLEYATLAFDATTGARLWLTRSHGQDEEGQPLASEAYDVEASPDGAFVYVLGNAGLEALDATMGEAIWRSEVMRCRGYWPMFNEECEVAVDPGMARLVAFARHDLAALDPRTGEVSWHNLLHLEEYPDLSRPYGMVLSPDGARVYVAAPGGKEDYLTDQTSAIDSVYETTAYDARDGGLIWRTIFDRGYNDAHSIGISEDGRRVFVTGEVIDLGLPDVVTVAYDTNLGLETLHL